jgi:crotonobetainyl-CoA:carnitine CoA-transferase CaiB-like acyl-CoA transferase
MPPPLLGQHTAEVLGELGVDDERLASLEERGVIARSPA